jgi:hypothetical protein
MGQLLLQRLQPSSTMLVLFPFVPAFTMRLLVIAKKSLAS